jgi:hypothetical protein
MASSLITALTVTTPDATTAPIPITDGEHNSLLSALAKVTRELNDPGSDPPRPMLGSIPTTIKT